MIENKILWNKGKILSCLKKSLKTKTNPFGDKIFLRSESSKEG